MTPTPEYPSAEVLKALVESNEARARYTIGLAGIGPRDPEENGRLYRAMQDADTTFLTALRKAREEKANLHYRDAQGGLCAAPSGERPEQPKCANCENPAQYCYACYSAEPVAPPPEQPKGERTCEEILQAGIHYSGSEATGHVRRELREALAAHRSEVATLFADVEGQRNAATYWHKNYLEVAKEREQPEHGRHREDCGGNNECKCGLADQVEVRRQDSGGPTKPASPASGANPDDPLHQQPKGERTCEEILEHLRNCLSGYSPEAALAIDALAAHRSEVATLLRAIVQEGK